MKKLRTYVDASVIGGCDDKDFAAGRLALFERFVEGRHTLVVSMHTLKELETAPLAVRNHLLRVPEKLQVVLGDSVEAAELAEAYLAHDILGPGSKADPLHVALATIGLADVLVSWNFKHIVNLGKIRLFNAVNLENGYGLLEIRTPKEVLDYD